MEKLKVNIPGREYEIYIDNGILNNTADYIRKIYSGEKIAVVTDSNVAPLYSEIVVSSLAQSGFETKLITVPAGEKSKSADCLMNLYNEMLDFKLTRTDLIIALGGGVIGDLTGYAAATLLRGIPYVQIPTTLLAQVDSSVGGKVAIDLPRGKNLVGAFKQPEMVIIDTDCLKTLTSRVLADGMAEVIKYGAIKDKKLFEMLESIKSTKELFANFGHTFGHAIEKKYNYETYTHGEGVAVGMVMSCEYGEKLGITHNGVTDRMISILKNYNLPVDVQISKDELAEAVAVDKKGEGSKINLILIEDIGKVMIKKLEKSDFLK